MKNGPYPQQQQHKYQVSHIIPVYKMRCNCCYRCVCANSSMVYDTAVVVLDIHSHDTYASTTELSSSVAQQCGQMQASPG